MLTVPSVRYRWIVAVLLAVGSQLPAAPSVTSTSGTAEHGATLNISGTGFGTKATPGPIRFDTFEDGVVGTNVTTTGFWSAEVPPLTLFDDATHAPLRHARSAKHIRWHSDALNRNRSFYKDDIGFESTGKAYVNVWLYMDFVSGTPELSAGWQLKLFRIQADSHHSLPPYLICNVMTLDEETVSYWVIPVSHNSSIWPGSGWMREHYWVNMAMEYKDSSMNTTDGQAHFYSSRPLVDSAYYKGSRTNIETRYDTVTAYANDLSLGYLLVNGGEEANTYWDDIYADNSWARVEIGDQPIYANCRHREMQVPTAWSPSSVSVTVNQGSFNNGQQVYLFVVDEDGATSAGLPVTLGGPVPHHLTVTNGSGSGDYDEGQVVAIAANPPSSGKAFAAWMGSFAYVADRLASQTTVTMPAQDISLTPAYVWVYQLTVNSGNGDGTYPATTVVNIEAAPAPSGMRFVEWTGNVLHVGDVHAQATTVTMPSSAVSVTATYAPAASWGDLNGDDFVGQVDLDIVLSQWGKGGEGNPITDPRADPTGDGFVGQADLDTVLACWGERR
jgi:hypothetical protein